MKGKNSRHSSAHVSWSARKTARMGRRSTLLMALLVASFPFLGRTEQMADKARDSALVSTALWQMLPAEPQRYDFEHHQFLFYIALVGCCATGCITGFAWGFCYRVVQREITVGDGKSNRQKHKQTQSQTTYTWNALTPRFTPVPAYAHGGWEV